MKTIKFALEKDYTSQVHEVRPQYVEYPDPGAVVGHQFGIEVGQFLASPQLLRTTEFEEIILISFDEPVSTGFALKHIRESGYLPATAKELIALYLSQPDVTLSANIVAFGQEKSHTDGCIKVVSVPAYWKWAHQDIGWHLWAHRMSGWKPFWQFAVVNK